MALRRVAKAVGLALAACALLLLVAMIALKLALDRVPRYQAEIRDWVHRQTGYYVRFAHVSPALRWYGPELSFRELELRSRDDRRVIARAARGRIGSDLWLLLSSGRLFAARIELDAPQIVVERAGPRRFALASEIPLTGGSAATAGFRLDDLPPGMLVIRDGRVIVTGWNASLPRLVLKGVNLQVRRGADTIRFGFDAHLPAALGGALQGSGRLVGSASPETAAWQGDLRADRVDFAGWRRLLPLYLGHLRRGSGSFEMSASGRGADLARAAFDFSASDVAARSATGSIARFERIAGDLRLLHDADRWNLIGRNVHAVRSGGADTPSNFEVTWSSGHGGALELSAHASYLRADSLLPLAGLLPQKSTRERLIAVAPTGEWIDSDLTLSRAAASAPVRFRVSARFRDAGFAPLGRAPGLRGLSGRLEGTQDAGHVTFASPSATIDWPRQWPQKVPLDLGGTIYWSRTPAQVLIATPRLELANRDARIALVAGLHWPIDGAGPWLDLSGRVQDVDVGDARLYLPRATLHPKTLAWLQRALVAGRIATARVAFRGPLRQFPFRDGSGTFRVGFDFDGATLAYGPGWPPLEKLAGHAEFLDQGLTVRLRSARADGLTLSGGEADFRDFRDAVLQVRAQSAGDVSAALRFLRDSPLDRLAHGGFSAVRASGAMRAQVRLRFPFKDFAHRRSLVRVHLSGVSVSRPGVGVRANGLHGDFTVDGAAVTRAQVRGQLLGGPLRIATEQPTGPAASGTRLRLSGRADGAAIAAAIGLRDTGAIAGSTDWQARILFTPAPQRQRRLRIDADLGGLALDLPAPLAKPKDEALPAEFELRWPKDAPALADFSLGSLVRGEAELPAGGAAIGRAAIVFGGGAPRLPKSAGWTVDGRIARLQLSGWRRLWRRGGGSDLSQYLKSAHLAIGEADYDGFGLREVQAELSVDASRYRVDLTGANAKGSVQWPTSAVRADPWTFDFDRLVVVAAAATGRTAADQLAASDGAAQIDPATLPAMHLNVAHLVWVGRDFGRVEAEVSPLADGLSLTRLAAVGRSFRVDARGDWRGPDGGAGHLVGDLSSSDVQSTLAALGYEKVIAAKKGRLDFDLHWNGAPTVDAFRDATGEVKIALRNGQVYGIKPGAGRVLGLASVAALPRRLALDFSDLTDKGLAFDTVSGSFDLRGGNAYTNDVLLKGPAAEIGLVGRIGLRDRDYDQVAVVTGSVGNSLPIAGALAGGPVVGAAVLLFTQVFKQPLRGLARGYYHITGRWSDPTVVRLKSAAAAAAEEGKR